MTALERLLIGAVVAALLAVGAWRVAMYYGDTRYDAGYDAAVAAGQKQRDREADENRKAESDLRAQLAARDVEAQRKEEKYAESLDAAQRRVRTGTDRLHCPAASPVQPAAAPGDRPAAAGAPADGQGPDVVPEAAADLLGIAADVAGLVRRYDQVVERFENCRAVNAK
jgi:hypothetical protein